MKQELFPRIISENHIELPKWLDNLIFNDLHANYNRQNSNMTNIDDNKEKTLNYLGTYFPRSYAESFCIFTKFFKENDPSFLQKEELSIFDFGCGTGGEIIGLLTVLEMFCTNLRKVKVVAFDGNQEALKLFEKILHKFHDYSNIDVVLRPVPFKIDDFYDLNLLNCVMKSDFDLAITFKAICEFVTKQQLEENNPYEHIANFLLPKIEKNGILLLEDITTYNNVAEKWLPKMMDQGLGKCNCNVLSKNQGYNQEYLITHSRKQFGISKVCWRMIKK